MNDNLNILYDNFFNKNVIDTNTGIVKGKEKRFATKIAIGDNYQIAKRKILFVSLDIGKDENLIDKNLNTFQDFEQRKKSVCESGYLENKNPHMAGVYGTALYFLKDYYNWISNWQLMESKNQFFNRILIENKEILPQDVLSYISLINFYNFVTIGRKERTGGSDRNFINEKDEIELLINIINTINPDVIIVQSKTLMNYFKNLIKPKISEKTEIFIGYHPSIFGRGIKNRIPKNYIKDLIENGKI